MRYVIDTDTGIELSVYGSSYEKTVSFFWGVKDTEDISIRDAEQFVKALQHAIDDAKAGAK